MSSKIAVKNLDEVYSLIKSSIGQLAGAGWSYYKGQPNFKGTTVLGWFMENISALKAGMPEAVIASGSNESEENYSWEADTLSIASSPCELGLVITVTTIKQHDNGRYDYSGRFRFEEPEIIKNVFLLEYV